MLSLLLISIGAVFLLRELIRGRFGDAVVVFRFSLRWTTEYFDEISVGCNALLDENTELITLSPEMGFLELKLNESKNILEKREQDARQAEQRSNEFFEITRFNLQTILLARGFNNILKIVAAHNGTIFARSGEEGTVFTIELPYLTVSL